ncbi:unnamed protein product [Mytilus edulis]|uniref:Uncharacterized protein n=1 Tax=Mytilus edulis TaxID=6550 RepID=A0A8S3Q401_MYTED|nr:unnamed protein product [Mytilus edulis]
MTRRRRRNNQNQNKQYTFDSSSSDQNSFADKRQCIKQSTGKKQKDKVHVNTSEQKSNDTYNVVKDMNNSFQYTPLTSTPGMTYQQNYSPVYPPPSVPPFMTYPMSPGIENTLRELCQKVTCIDLKMTKLDKIEERLELIDNRFKSVDTDMSSCKQRLNHLEQNGQFLSDVHDEQAALKKKLDTMTSTIEKTKNFSSKLLDIETQNLEKNLLFFSFDEEPVKINTNDNNTDKQGEGDQSGENERCKEQILEFLENTMKLEGATNIHLEKVFRLGKRKPDAIRPRPIVVKFSRLSDRAKVKNASGRLKDTKFGISPQYPREIVERRKKLVPIMLKERKQNKTAYIVGDKLYVNGEIWEG